MKTLLLILLLTFSLNSYSQDKIPGQFIIIIDKEQGPEALDELILDYKLMTIHIYQKALKGFSAKLNSEELNELKNDPRVVYIEQDQEIKINDLSAEAPWGLDRIDQRNLPLNNLYRYLFTGLGVTAYIIDTGIRYDHQEFGGRASFGFDSFGETGADCHGHGTHVSGTVGGTNYGVAKAVALKSVRVLDCRGSGSTSGVIAGLDWVMKNASYPAVANMSLGGGASFALDQAVTNLIFSGVSVAVAAGNEGRDACLASPSRVPDAVTVGATGKTDSKTSWSNFGNCIDLFAPGEGILSSWNTNASATNTISGTSMATPHVTGVMALLLQNHPAWSSKSVRDQLLSFSSKNSVNSSKSFNNHMLYALEEISGSGDYLSPETIVTSPLNNAVVPRNKTIVITATASDNQKISSLRFYVNGSLLCTSSSAPYFCNWRVPGGTPKVYFLQTTAIDESNNAASSLFTKVSSK